MFYVVPFLGGYQRVNSYKVYNEDKYTFDNAKITENQIYEESFEMIKLKLFQILGKE